MKTTYLARNETLDRKWIHVDAEGQVLGRLAVAVARRLMGKHRPTFTPHVDTGEFVVVTNAAKIRVTGRKAESKVYRHHTGHIGSLVERTYSDLLAQKPEEIIHLAVRRMLPKTRLGRKMFSKLKIYRGPEHPHEAQRPEKISL